LTNAIKGFFIKKSPTIFQYITENFDASNESKIAACQRELAKHAKAVWRIQELD
jgi:hypothetical protein